MPTDRAVSRTPFRLGLAPWALALLSLVANFLTVAPPARGGRAPAASTVVAQRPGRRVARQGGAVAPAASVIPAAAGARPVHRWSAAALPTAAIALAPAAPPPAPVRPGAGLRGIPAPGHPAPSSRAPPVG